MRRSLAPSRSLPGTTSRQSCDGTEREESAVSRKVYSTNARQLSQGTVSVVRAPFLSILTCPGTCIQAFKPPAGAVRTDSSDVLLRRKSLGVRKSFQPLQPNRFKTPSKSSQDSDIDITGGDAEDEAEQKEKVADPDEPPVEPLVLWTSEEDSTHCISVDMGLCKFLRPHQREGVRFMFECLMGLRNFPGSGCILADDMGLGKTLQSIAVMWTLLRQGTARGGPPVAKRCVVVCPTSLVSNWEAELDKWLKGACKCVALSETSRDQVISGINLYLSSPIYKVLIVSYETFRMHAARFGGAHANTSCDLLVCDEAHRLKNGDTATSKALAGLKCRRRVLLSGTPMQNDLEEFYAMVDFANPGALGDQTHFRRHFLSAITAAREPDATDGQRAKAQKVQNEMSTLVNEFILRRTNTLNAKHLPPKLVQVVACRLTDVQRRIYQHLLDSKEIRHILNGKQTNILSSIGSMQKLCNHPKLLEAGAAAAAGAKRGAGGPSTAEHLAEEVASMLPAESGRGRSVHPEWSGKMETLFRLMQGMRKSGDDRIVVVSNYTSALDLIGRMCQENHWPYCRLDGSTGGKKRKSMVAQFNDQKTDNFAFLLSSKAGGCGLNLIGGNRLVLFDPDWNPAVDKQAAARVWRDGQRKRCYVYRFISTGTIEEKIFQRQLSKEGLQSVVEDQAEVNSLSSKDLRNLFKLRDGTPCDTHDKLRCGRCDMGAALAAARDDEAEACHAALPKQLDMCMALLQEMRACPEAAHFNAEGLLALHESAQVLAPGVFEERCGEVIHFGQIADKLEQGLAAAHTAQSPATPAAAAESASDAPAGGSDGTGASGTSGGGGGGSSAAAAALARPGGSGGYGGAAAVPAFARDMKVAMGVPERVWGKDIKLNPLVAAARVLRARFDERWGVLAPILMGIKETERQAVRERRQAEQQAAAAAGAGAAAAAAAAAPPAGAAAAAQRFQAQLGMPKEEDLNSWSHHFSTDTVDDEVFRTAMAGTADSLVTFVFGLEVTWDLLQAQVAEETAEKERLADLKSAEAAAQAKAFTEFHSDSENEKNEDVEAPAAASDGDESDDEHAMLEDVEGGENAGDAQNRHSQETDMLVDSTQCAPPVTAAPAEASAVDTNRDAGDAPKTGSSSTAKQRSAEDRGSSGGAGDAGGGSEGVGTAAATASAKRSRRSSSGSAAAAAAAAAPAAAAATPPGEWSCEQCTYINHCKGGRCTMCGRKGRPAKAAAGAKRKASSSSSSAQKGEAGGRQSTRRKVGGGARSQPATLAAVAAGSSGSDGGAMASSDDDDDDFE